MYRRSSTMTDVSVRLSEDAVDQNGVALYPDTIMASPNDNSTIAPWIDEPPTPPPKPMPSRSFGFAPKNSFSSFVSMRQGSTSTLFRHGRPSDSQSTLNIPEIMRRSVDENEGMVHSGSSTTSTELRKSKSSINFLARLRPRPSRTHLRSDSSETEHPSLRTPAPPLPNQPYGKLSIPTITSPSLISVGLPLSKKEKREKKKKSSFNPQLPPSPPPKDGDIELDLNLDRMDGIVDLTVSSPARDPNSPSSAMGSSSFSHSHSDQGSFANPSILTSADFSNPFSPTVDKPKGPVTPIGDYRKISPKTIVPAVNYHPLPQLPPTALPGSPTWVPPESWAVEKKEGDDLLEEGYSSSDESNHGKAKGLNVEDRPSPATHHLVPNGLLAPRRKRKTMKRRLSVPEKPYRIRIYRANNTYHVVSVPFSVTVANLTPALNKKLLLGEDRDIQHRLYLKERGRERLLAQTEKPADIVRRRLEQAGYDSVDGLELLGGEGLSFLLKFVYKSQLLGPADEDLKFDTFDFIDLTGRSLRTIPVILHQNADSIISLKLSRNPMLEIPLDFIQSCTNLRELRLSNMAMKKVPQSVRHSSTLLRLDLSSNRISDLDEAHLHDIPGLLTLFVQNNRIEKLPRHFPLLRFLVILNISNNKFRTFPLVVTQLESLRDLDISFNTITELPDEIGQLMMLERLIIVGNQVSRFPDQCSSLHNLQVLDCRRNQISDLTVVCMLPKIRFISADHNTVHALDLSVGPNLAQLDVSYNDVTQLSMVPGPIGKSPYALTSLDLSCAKLSSLDDLAVSQLATLVALKIDHNSFRYLPDTLGDLKLLETFSCSDNKLDALPSTIGLLQKLTFLDAHNNSLTELPQTLWNCRSLAQINLTSNFLGTWHDPPVTIISGDTVIEDVVLTSESGRKLSSASIASIHSLPPLVHSLKKLYLGENRLTDDVLRPLMIFKELRVLNLSFNEIQDLPPSFFRNMIHLHEIYLSGNKLTSLPTEDLPRLTKLTTLFLNGNKLQTLPQELGKVNSLTVLDVGSNLLKYNINNLEFDWNWNFNKNLRYLNLSGNKRLQVKSDMARQLNNRQSVANFGRQSFSGFTNLTHLRVLGLMDVTITTTGMDTTVDIPDENEDRRVRTSLSTISGMAYGIADALGRNDYLNMLDLVHEFIGRPDEAIFAMFGRVQPPKALPPGASPNRLSKFLHDKFVNVFHAQLEALNPEQSETVPDALRRTFLKLNQDLHDSLFTSPRKLSQTSNSVTTSASVDPATLRSGASGIVLYFKHQTLYVANVGNALAVVSRQGVAQSISTKHEPYDRSETSRIRAAEGWVSPPGLVNDEVDVSRSFGFYHLLPIVNARPDVCVWDLTELDEFVIVANRGLWDYVSYQTAVDIARTVARAERPDPMIAAQKLRDFAISYGADGSTMIMVIWVADLFDSQIRSRQPTLDPIADAHIYRTRKRDEILDRSIARLDGEVPAPIGHLALAFTDIRNSTHLWEVNPGMPTAMRLHNSLLRRQLRFCGGYEVKTEGDAFMCSFPTALAAVWWCLTVQNQLLHEPWPLEILECEDGKPISDANGRLIARGLSVRMGVHCGMPVCEPDPITHRMDYFGPIVNRASRVSGNAAGGQIMCSADIIRELNAKIFESQPETEYSRLQPQQAVDAIRRMGVVIIPVGEVKLKGLELPELLSLIYPEGLEGRQDLKETPEDDTASASRVQFSVPQLRELGVLCLRLEALSSGRIFRPLPERKASIQSAENEVEEHNSRYVYGDPFLLLPPMSDKSSDTELMLVLDSLSVRISNALSSMAEEPAPVIDKAALVSTLMGDGTFDETTMKYLCSIIRRM